MKAVVWRGERTLEIETVEDARLEAPTDVLLRLTSTAICGTDLHIYEGRMGEVNGMVIGGIASPSSAPARSVCSPPTAPCTCAERRRCTLSTTSPNASTWPGSLEPSRSTFGK